MNASNLEDQYERKTDSLWIMLLTYGAGVFAAFTFKDIFELPFLTTLGVFWWLVLLIEYWIPPRPQTSFLVWSAKVTILAFGFVLCLSLIPIWLTNLIWKPLAYGLPTLAFIICSCWLQPLYPVSEKITLRDATLFGLVFAVIYGTVMNFFG